MYVCDKSELVFMLFKGVLSSFGGQNFMPLLCVQYPVCRLSKHTHIRDPNVSSKADCPHVFQPALNVFPHCLINSVSSNAL